MVSEVPDPPPHVFPTGLRLDQYGGNAIVLASAPGPTPSYAHARPGSVSVRPGDRVTKRQETGHNLPFLIDRFEFKTARRSASSVHARATTLAPLIGLASCSNQSSIPSLGSMRARDYHLPARP